MYLPLVSLMVFGVEKIYFAGHSYFEHFNVYTIKSYKSNTKYSVDSLRNVLRNNKINFKTKHFYVYCGTNDVYCSTNYSSKFYT